MKIIFTTFVAFLRQIFFNLEGYPKMPVTVNALGWTSCNSIEWYFSNQSYLDLFVTVSRITTHSFTSPNCSKYRCSVSRWQKLSIGKWIGQCDNSIDMGMDEPKWIAENNSILALCNKWSKSTRQVYNGPRVVKFITAVRK